LQIYPHAVTNARNAFRLQNDSGYIINLKDMYIQQENTECPVSITRMHCSSFNSQLRYRW